MEVFGNNYVSVLDSSKSVHTTIKGGTVFNHYCFLCKQEKMIQKCNVKTEADFFWENKL